MGTRSDVQVCQGCRSSIDEGMKFVSSCIIKIPGLYLKNLFIDEFAK